MTSSYIAYLELAAIRRRSALPFLALLLAVTCLLVAGYPVLAEDLKAGATTANSSDKKRLLIVGSTTTVPLVEKIASQFIRQHPGVEIVVEMGGSGRGVKDTLSGQADIGMVSRPLKAEEKTLFVIPIARDGAALVVHKSNPVRTLSSTQARDIFSGRINNWEALGGPSQPIVVLRRAKGQGVTEVINHYLDLKTEENTLSKEVVLNDEVVKAVTSNPNALSILSIGVAKDAMEKDLPLKALALDGITADTDSLRNGSWPMSRSLTLVTRSVPTGLAQEFIRFALSPDAQPMILEQNFIPY